MRGAEISPHRCVEEVLTPEAVAFLSELEREFRPTRDKLLDRRQDRRARLRAGELPDFLDETAAVRAGDWQVAPAPRDLADRRVEITGPVDRKMIINALRVRSMCETRCAAQSHLKQRASRTGSTETSPRSWFAPEAGTSKRSTCGSMAAP